MGHMQAQIVGPQDWWEVETTDGTCWVQCEDAGYKDVIAKDLMPYLSVPDTSHVMRWEFKSGYGARLSAPGYTDCTDWCVSDSEEEAKAYLAEQYELCPICLKDEWVEDEAGISCGACVSALTSEEFDDAMDMVVGDMSAGDIVSIPGVYEIVSEALNNDIIQQAYDKKVIEDACR